MNLNSLDLGYCNFTEDVIDSITQLTNLNKLDLSVRNCIGAKHTQKLGGMSNLTHLDLQLCYLINDEGLFYLTPLTKLQYLDLKSCYGITSQGMGHMTVFTNLTHLNIAYNKSITQEGVRHLSMLADKNTGKLKRLILESCDKECDNEDFMKELTEKMKNVKIEKDPDDIDF